MNRRDYALSLILSMASTTVIIVASLATKSFDVPTTSVLEFSAVCVGTVWLTWPGLWRRHRALSVAQGAIALSTSVFFGLGGSSRSELRGLAFVAGLLTNLAISFLAVNVVSVSRRLTARRGRR